MQELILFSEFLLWGIYLFSLVSSPFSYKVLTNILSDLQIPVIFFHILFWSESFIQFLVVDCFHSTVYERADILYQLINPWDANLLVFVYWVPHPRDQTDYIIYLTLTHLVSLQDIGNHGSPQPHKDEVKIEKKIIC